MKKILILGPQGCGKSTQSAIIGQKQNLSQIHVGSLLRQIAETDHEDVNHIKEALETGQLVDDAVVGKIVQKALDEHPNPNGFVMDGYPRSMEQLNYFNPNYDRVILLQVPDEIVIKRLLGRGREDDTPELIQERLSIYHEETEPLIKYFESQGKLVRIDGSQSIDKIAEDILGHLQD